MIRPNETAILKTVHSLQLGSVLICSISDRLPRHAAGNSQLATIMSIIILSFLLTILI